MPFEVTPGRQAMLVKTATRTTAGRGRLFDSILETVGDTPTIRINNLGVGHATIYVKAEFFNPAASVKDRLALNIIEEAERSGALVARTDRRRGDQRQHRHRACHGVRAEGLPAGRDHGRQLFHRAPQADAHARRQGGADAARPEGVRHVQQGRRAGRGQRLVPRPPVRDQGQCRHPRGDDGARDHQ